MQGERAVAALHVHVCSENGKRRGKGFEDAVVAGSTRAASSLRERLDPLIRKQAGERGPATRGDLARRRVITVHSALYTGSVLYCDAFMAQCQPQAVSDLGAIRARVRLREELLVDIAAHEQCRCLLGPVHRTVRHPPDQPVRRVRAIEPQPQPHLRGRTLDFRVQAFRANSKSCEHQTVQEGC